MSSPLTAREKTLFAVVLALALLFLVPVAVNSLPGRTVAADEPVAPTSGVYSIATVKPERLTPSRSVTAYTIEIASGLFDALTAVDPQGGVVMRAAESVTSTDQVHWTIKLRSGQIFHNGEPVTAASFADAWNAAAYGPNGWPANPYFRNIAGYDALNPAGGTPAATTLSGLRVVDDLTLEVTLNAPFGQFPQVLSYLGFAPMPKAAFADLEAYDQHPIGNGPFAVADGTDTATQVQLVRFARYAGPRPARSEGVTFRYFPTLAAAYADTRDGGSDVMLHIPPEAVQEARQAFGDRFQQTGSAVVEYLGLPMYDPQLANLDTRRAISMAIDRDKITNDVLGGAFEPLHSLLPPVLPGSRAGSCGVYCGYHPDLARQLLMEGGGWKGTLTLYYPEGDESYNKAIREVGAQLQANLGITDVQYSTATTPDYYSTLASQHSPGPFRFNWVMDYPSVENYLTTLSGPANWLGYSGPAAQDAVVRGDAAKNPVKGLPYYGLAEAGVLDDLPAVPLWNWRALSGHSARVTDVHTDPFANLRLDEVRVTA